MYKIVLIDIDDTIFDFKKGEANSLKETLFDFDIAYSEEIYQKFSDINEFYFQEYASDKMTREMFHFNRFNELLKYLKINDLDPVILNSNYLNNLSMQTEYVDGAKELVDRLSKNYILVAASNGKYEVQVNRLKKAGILDLFDEVFVSSKVGFNKPDKRFFDAIFEKYKSYKKDDFIMIGDRLDSDIVGAYNSQIDSIYFNRKSEENSDVVTYTVSSLEQIYKIMAI